MFPTEAVPDRIGNYKVIRRLSRTGSADVYLGRMEGPMGFKRLCELKLVQNTLEGDHELAEELAREAAICSRLNHPAILRMFDFFEFEKRLVLVVEHVDGADLERLLQHLQRRKQKLGDEAIWYIAQQLVGALSHAHSATDEDGNLTPVVHRSLAPDNVLVGWDGQVRLAGFGLGKILGRSPDTVVGVIKGRPGYMAPEQARGERVTPRADVYGIGLLLWCLLSGRVPPVNGMKPESLSKIRPDVAMEIAAAIEAALEPSPDKRKITCTELEHWLKKITKVDAGRQELRDKILMLRSTRSPVSDGADPPHTARPSPKVTARRRLSVRGLHAQQPPSQAPVARNSSRPPSRFGTSTAPPPSGTDSRRAPASARPDDVFADDDRIPHSARPGSFGSPRVPRADGAPPSFAPPVAAPDSVAPRGLASQPPPPLGMGMNTQVMPPPPAPPPPNWISPPASPSESHGPSVASAPAASTRNGETPANGSNGESVKYRAALVTAPMRDEMGSFPDRVSRLYRGRSRPLSAMQSIAVAAITAGLIVGLGVYIESRVQRPAAAPSPPSVVMIPMANPSGEAVRAPPPPPATATPAPVGDTLPGGYGLITVTSPVAAIVFVNGHKMGKSNEPFQAPCGNRFIRLGTMSDDGDGPFWVAPGLTVGIPCQGSVHVESRPAPSPPSRSTRTRAREASKLPSKL